MKLIKKKLVSWLGPWLAYWVIRILGSTMKFEVIHPEIPNSFWEKNVPAIGVFWHGRLLLMPHIYRGKKLSFLVSLHRDGQIVSRALGKFNFLPIMGSTRRGGSSAFLQMIKALQGGSDVAIVPDGPRGPRQYLQFGVIELARRTGSAIVPLAFSASKRKIFNTWDRFLLPYPFSKGVFIWGEPIYIDRDGDRDYLEERRGFVERRLNELTEEADRYFE